MTKELQSSRYIVISFLVREMGIDIVEALSLMAELEKMVNDPEKLADFTMDQSFDDAIDEAKSQITFAQEGVVKQKEMVR